MNTTPDTLTYMIAGYLAFTLVMLLYIISLVLRHRHMKRDLMWLEEQKTK